MVVADSARCIACPTKGQPRDRLRSEMGDDVIPPSTPDVSSRLIKLAAGVGAMIVGVFPHQRPLARSGLRVLPGNGRWGCTMWHMRADDCHGRPWGKGFGAGRPLSPFGPCVLGMLCHGAHSSRCRRRTGCPDVYSSGPRICVSRCSWGRPYIMYMSLGGKMHARRDGVDCLGEAHLLRTGSRYHVGKTPQPPNPHPGIRGMDGLVDLGMGG